MLNIYLTLINLKDVNLNNSYNHITLHVFSLLPDQVVFDCDYLIDKDFRGEESLESHTGLPVGVAVLS